MPKFEVIVTRTKVEVASVEVTAKTHKEAEEKVRAKMEPNYSAISENIEKMEKAANRYFKSNPAEGADETTEFEYEVEEL